MPAPLRRSREVDLVFNGPSSEEREPVVLSGFQKECGRDQDQLGPLSGQKSIQFREAQVVADRQADAGHVVVHSHHLVSWRDRDGDHTRNRRADLAGIADAGTSENIFQDLWDHFARPTAWQPTAQGPAIVAAAREAGLDVALASNFDERLFEVAAVVEPLVQAAHVFPSSELGWRKPATGFYRAVEARLGMQPTELVMFGDNRELDVVAARRAGWHAVLLPLVGLGAV
ncbi:hypothetical protein EBU58_14890 [bacterium]|nr:hypothetical protein [bacterium]